VSGNLRRGTNEGRRLAPAKPQHGGPVNLFVTPAHHVVDAHVLSGCHLTKERPTPPHRPSDPQTRCLLLTKKLHQPTTFQVIADVHLYARASNGTVTEKPQSPTPRSKLRGARQARQKRHRELGSTTTPANDSLHPDSSGQALQQPSVPPPQPVRGQKRKRKRKRKKTKGKPNNAAYCHCLLKRNDNNAWNWPTQLLLQGTKLMKFHGVV